MAAPIVAAPDPLMAVAVAETNTVDALPGNCLEAVGIFDGDIFDDEIFDTDATPVGSTATAIKG